MTRKTKEIQMKENKDLEVYVITPLVLQIQEGNENDWYELMNLIQKHKSGMVNKFFRKLCVYTTKEDVSAKYDDILMYAVKKYDHRQIDNFMRFFTALLNQQMPHLKRTAETVKNKSNNETVHLDFIVDTETGTTMTETLQDTPTQLENFEEIDSLISLLNKYGEQSETTKLNAELLLSSAIGEENSEERKKLILSVLPDGTSWSSARKKLERARKSFKKYLSESK